MKKGIAGLVVLAGIVVIGGLISAMFFGGALQTMIRPWSQMGVEYSEYTLSGGTTTPTLQVTQSYHHSSGLNLKYIRLQLTSMYQDDNICSSGFQTTQFCGVDSVKCYKGGGSWITLGSSHNLVTSDWRYSPIILEYEDIDCELVEVEFRVKSDNYKKATLKAEYLPKTYTAILETRDLGVPQTVNCPSSYEFCHFETKNCDILLDKITGEQFNCIQGKCIESFGVVDETYECFKPTQNLDSTMTIYGDSYEVICDNNGVCDSGENCENCLSDCPISSEAICCNGVETFTECDSDYDCQAGGECSTGTCQNPGTCEARCVYQGLPDNTAVGNKICCDGKEVNPICINDYNCNDNSICTDDKCNNPGTCSASCSNPVKQGYYIDPTSGVCHSPCSDGTGVNECSAYQTGFRCTI